jgi:segregation and condensation protein B
MNLKTLVESILFISNKPLTSKKLAEFCDCGKAEVETVLEVIKNQYNNEIKESGVKFLEHDGAVQLVTAPESSGVIEKFLKEEMTGEMTRPQLEALTIIAYRGPITKMELEQIRGVNCSLILRNLLIRGLVESQMDKKIGVPLFKVTLDFVRFLGLTNIKDLPDYEKLSQSEVIQSILERNMNAPEAVDKEKQAE